MQDAVRHGDGEDSGQESNVAPSERHGGALEKGSANRQWEALARASEDQTAAPSVGPKDNISVQKGPGTTWLVCPVF